MKKSVVRLIYFFLCSGLITITSMNYGQTTWYVDDDAPPGGDGSVLNPFNTIQDGIDAATNGDMVLTAPGTYLENIDFNGKAITVKSSEGADVTMIDGGNPSDPEVGSVVTFQNGEDMDSVLEGFSVTHGSGTFDGLFSYCGGGIYCANNSHPRINACEVKNNDATLGAGIYCSTSSPTITFCTITDNLASDQRSGDGEGGGLACVDGSHATIDHCFISRNIASDAYRPRGGGIFCDESDPTIKHCTISTNTAEPISGWGGGIYCDESSPTMTHCHITNNHTPGTHRGTGGGIYFNCFDPCHPLISHCTISRNSASGTDDWFV